MTKKLLQHVLGPRASIDLVTPVGVDGKKVFEFMVLRQQQTALELLQEAAAAVGAMNESLISEYGGLLTVTESLYSIARQGEGTRKMTPKKSEFTAPDPDRSDLIGHMLPLEKYFDALGWTRDYLVDASPAQTAADIQLLCEKLRNRFEFELFTRMFGTAENAIGTTGYDVPWVHGTGGNVDFVPPQYGPNLFDSTHDHFIGKNSSSGDTYDDVIEGQVATLREHGIKGRLALLVSDDDMPTISALTNFIKLIPSQLNVVGGNSGSPIAYATGEYEGIPGELAGYYNSAKGLVEVYPHTRIPTGYSFMTKPYGVGNAANGLAIRVHPARGFGMALDPLVVNVQNPRFERVDAETWFGVGVNDRLNGAPGLLVAGGTYVAPSASALGA